MVSVATLQLVVEGKNEASAVLKDVDRDASGLGNTLKDVGKIAGGFLTANVIQAGVSGLKGFLGDGVQQASDLEQTIGGVQAVFGDAADPILKFGETADQSVGLSRNAFNSLAAPLGAMLKSAGFGMEDVTGHTLDLTTKAADLAATFGGPVEDAMQAISSLMRGETNPIERYGVAIKQSDVNMKALAMTGKQSVNDLSPLELQQARLALLFEQTADSQGQFGREADTAAGKAERLKAQQENLAAAMGEHLLPVSMKITEIKAKLAEILATKVVPLIAELAPKVGAVAEAFGNAVIPIVQQFVQTHGPAIGAIAEWIGGKLAEFGAKAKEEFAKFQGYYQTDIKPAMDNIKSAIGVVIDWVVENWPRIEAIVRPVMDQVVNIISTAWGIISNILQIAIDLIGGDFSGAWENLKELMGVIWEGIKETIDNALEFVKGIMSAAWAVIQEVAGIAWDWLKTTISDALADIKEWMGNLPGEIRDKLGDLTSYLKQKGIDLLNGLWDGAKEKWGELIEWVGELPGKIVDGVGNITHLLWDEGWEIMMSLWAGMKRVWEDVKGWLGGLGGAIKGLKGPIEQDRKLLNAEGAAIMEGLAAGMQAGYQSSVVPTLSAMAGNITGHFKRGPTIGVGVAATYSAMGAGAGGGNTYNFTPTINIYGAADAGSVRGALDAWWEETKRHELGAGAVAWGVTG